MENIFDTEQIIESRKITPKEFEERTKRLLNKIFNEYAASFERPLVTDEEADAAPCEKCQGSMCWKFNNEEMQCFQDKEQGECHKVILNDDLLGGVIANIIETDNDFNELLGCDIG